MSISSRMALYSLSRSDNTLDSYGIMSSTPAKVADIYVSITKFKPSQNVNSPLYDFTLYVGITEYDDIRVGDIIEDALATQYKVRAVGSKGSVYLPVYLDKQ